MVNQFLQELSIEEQSNLYSTFGTIKDCVVIIALLLSCKRYQLEKKLCVRLFVVYAVAFYVGNISCNVLGALTKGVIPKINLGVAFLVFLVVFVLLVRLLKGSVQQFIDIAIPVFILGRGVGIIGCLFEGCCHGFPAAWGIYSDNAGTTVVPTVLIDIVASYIIVAYLLLAGKKKPVPGMVAAKGILLFGVLRYVVDILRDNDKLFGMMTVEGICGIVYVLTGLILLYIVTNKKAQAEEACTN